MTAPNSLIAICIGLGISTTGTQAATEASSDADAYPVVLTPTRLRQSLQDVPASVTVVTADMLRKYAIRSIPEALRLVPGMAVTQASGPDYRINYHGTNVLVPRRMNVLIDGVSVYQPLFARVDWANLPIAIADVDRIEVTRGPNSAAYGPNSLLAIVNIISKHPRDSDAFFASVEKGGNGIESATVRLGTTVGDAALRFTLNHERDGGYDAQQRAGSDHDGLRMSRINIRAVKPLGATTLLDFNAGYVAGTKEVPGADSGGVTFPDAKPQDSYLSATLTHSFDSTHELQVRAYSWIDKIEQSWRTCYASALFLPEMFNLYRSNSAYANAVVTGRIPSGGSQTDDALAVAAITAIKALGPRATSLTCANAEQGLVQRRVDLEVQDTYVLSDRVRFVLGAGVRRQSGSSATYIGTALSNTVWRTFGNLEYRPAPAFAVNLGAYVEQDELSGHSASPRVALNYRLSDLQTLRLVWSKGTRTPDVQEQRANWTYTLTDASPPFNGASTVRLFQSAVSPGGLQSEHIRSAEVGYLLNVPSYGFLLDLKLFDDRLSSLISEKLQLSSFKPTNNGGTHLSGLEVQANALISADWSFFFNYSYLLNRDQTSPLEVTQYSRNSGSLGCWLAMGDGWSGSIAYFGASGDGIGQSPYGRTDLTVAKSLRYDPGKAEISFTAEHSDNPQQTYFRDFGAANTLRASYNSRWQFRAQFRVGF